MKSSTFTGQGETLKLQESKTDISNENLNTDKERPSEDSPQIMGIKGQIVPVFALLNSKKITLFCITEKLMMQRISKGSYKWTIPSDISKENKRFIILDGDSLVLYSINPGDSGEYNCKYSYIHNNEKITITFHFRVSVYHMPGKSIQFFSTFSIDDCENNSFSKFTTALLQNIENLVSDLQCQIQLHSTHCHITTEEIKAVMHTLKLQVDVLPFGLGYCSSPTCETYNTNIKEAYERIKQFFVIHTDGFNNTLNVKYVLRSFTAVKVDHCNPGYGKIMGSSTACQGCCIACPPGKFSARLDTLCISCATGSFNADYGQTACINCPENEFSDRQGSSSIAECHVILPMWIIILISCIGTCLIGAIFCIILNKCCRRRLASQYIDTVESEMKRMLKRLAVIANEGDIQKQRSKLTNPLHKRTKLRKNNVAFSNKQSTRLLSTDESKGEDTDKELSSTSDYISR
ncbi:zona pellucida-binding protein 2-like isoform X2 [Ascaphus truei]